MHAVCARCVWLKLVVSTFQFMRLPETYSICRSSDGWAACFHACCTHWLNVTLTADDFDIFKSRVGSNGEVDIYLSGRSIPPAEKQPLPGTRPHSFSPAMVSAIQGGSGSSNGYDTQSIHSSTSRNGPAGKNTSIHLIASSDTASQNDGDNVTIGNKSTRSVKTLAERAAASGVPVHKLAFDEFHNQLGVRTFVGSIGPIENVRMMMKPGHRHCYMAREFALQHGFIPKDAAPGFYGFSGITNLGSWPIRVGGRTVELQVMLIENSYFPVILGRSFMEKRHVQTNPIDQTHVRCMIATT